MTVDLTRFVSMFFQETEEHLATMETHLLRLNSTAPDAQALDAILRAAHCVKGNSTIFGATRFSEVMHRIETLLNQMRGHQIQPTDDIISVLLEACDGVREELRRLKDKDETDPLALKDVYDRLTRLTTCDPALTYTQRALSPTAQRSERFRVDVELPAGQGITGLPLGSLYAALALLGRVEDVQITEGNDGSASLSLFLLTTQSISDIHEKLRGVLGSAGMRIEPHTDSPRPVSFASEPPRYSDASSLSYGLFSAEAALSQTTLFTGATGRRASDHESTSTAFGRRTIDGRSVDRSSIRVDVDKVDRLLNLVGELVIAQSMLAEAAEHSSACGDSRLRHSVAYVGRQTRDLQDAVMGIRLLPLDSLFSRMPRLVRDLAQRLGKDVELATHGGETELDKEMIEKLVDPLTHLVRNSIDHGIERAEVRQAAGKERTGKIHISAAHQGGAVVVQIQDDGAGFDREKILRKAQEQGLHSHASMTDEEVWTLVFAPGFTTAVEVSEVSGRGIGMNVVQRNVRALSGHIDIRSRRDIGTTIVIRVPLTLAILEGMSVEIGSETFIIPLSLISEAFLPQAGQIKSIASGAQVMQVRDAYVPVLTLEPLLGIHGRASMQDSIALVVEVDGQRAALAVDRLLGQQQIVIKSLEANYRRVAGIAGATVLGNGRVALILDVNALLRSELAPLKSAEQLHI